MHRSILVVEDDSKLSKLLSDYLGQHGFKVHVVHHPNDALRYLKTTTPDLILLDVMLPEKSGLEICREVRAERDIPIILLTARGELTDRVVGLEMGADDYVSKPFEPRELVARIEAVLRRGKTVQRQKIIHSEDLVIDLGKRLVLRAGQPLALSTLEFDVLVLFASNPGRTFNRDQIMDALKGVEWDAMNRAIDVLISRLRGKLGDNPKSPKYLRTMWGTGYLWIAKTETVSDAG